MEKFLSNPKEVELIREIFTGIYSLDFDQFGNEAVELALREPEKFVLKPQREGGGNNIYGLDVKRKMEGELLSSRLAFAVARPLSHGDESSPLTATSK